MKGVFWGAGGSSGPPARNMRNRYFMAAGVVLLLAGAVVALEHTIGQMAFRTKYGTVTYNHVAHTKRASFNCIRCHTEEFKVFPPLTRGPLHYRTIQHRSSEAAHKSCGMCHRAGGESFPTSGYCRECHVTAVVTPYY